jgi:hypothetical protein
VRFRCGRCDYSDNKVGNSDIASKPGSYNLTKCEEDRLLDFITL